MIQTLEERLHNYSEKQEWAKKGRDIQKKLLLAEYLISETQEAKGANSTKKGFD